MVMKTLGNLIACTTRLKLRTITICVLVFSLLLLLYQMLVIYKLSDNSIEDLRDSKRFNIKKNIFDSVSSRNATFKTVVLSSEPKNEHKFLGTLLSDDKYIPNMSGKIWCVMDSIEIDVLKVNDDYCDCPADGMDEPGTNACKNGRFFCNNQPDPINFPKFIPSSRVNDGICDCCDGSDEWSGFVLPHRLPENVQKNLKKFQSPCSLHC